MKKILGLDLGTTSIGWAVVEEAQNSQELSSIKKLGVRVIPLTTDEEADFKKGKSITINADRTLKRSARRNLDRFQLRRKALRNVLLENGWIDSVKKIVESGPNTTFESLKLRSLAAKERISLKDFARVLLMINKKRGYKSSRKAKGDEDGTMIDGMEIAKCLYINNLTPGEYILKQLQNKERITSDFYQSDLDAEFRRIWSCQKDFYPKELTDDAFNELFRKTWQQTWAICAKLFQVEGIAQVGSQAEKKLELYSWRVKSLTEKVNLESLALIFQEINGQIKNSSGYLGAISDRSKELYFNKLTVGEYQYNAILNNPQARLKGMVFYRMDYLDEFEKIWETQARYYSELTNDLKSKIRDTIIFYQRRLKSQKHLISTCEFEKYHKVIPKSAPLFQEFKIWQVLNNLAIKQISTGQVFVLSDFEDENIQNLYRELSIRKKLSNNAVLSFLVKNAKDFELNYKDGISGNETNARFYDAYYKILEFENEVHDFDKLPSSKINDILVSKFSELGICQELLDFKYYLTGNEFDKQPIMQLWHLLYSFEGDQSKSGVDKLISKLVEKFGFKVAHAKILTKIDFSNDYGNLSSRAIRQILPGLIDGYKYDIACANVGYNHSNSMTAAENETRVLDAKLNLLKRNSLRNPVVEKILNQVVNLVNAIIDDADLGKPDEIRLELARELKSNAKQREKMTAEIQRANKENEKVRTILEKLHPFNQGIRITKNDIIKYKLYQELAPLGFKTIYTGTYIPLDRLFSNEFEIEHIIPQSLLFDDSFSNKTLSTRDFNNRIKGSQTGIDAIINTWGKDSNEYHSYISNVETLFSKGSGTISKTKHNKLLMPLDKIPSDFIERDLRNTQYITKMAKQMLSGIVKNVVVTTGSITDRLREDWQLIQVMQEINIDKFEKLGLVYYETNKQGQQIPKIRDWTKRSDHRHHAMDALTVAFTRHEHIQYLNNLNARQFESEKGASIIGIEKKFLYRDDDKKLLFVPPMPIADFRVEAKKNLESILVSFKAKNKVVTVNRNYIKIKGKDNFLEKKELTPRGQLHNETIYGSRLEYSVTEEKVNSSFDEDKISRVANKKYREALLIRLNESENNPTAAFTGKNALAKKPLFIKGSGNQVPERLKLVDLVKVYTVRKEINPTNINSEKVIEKIIDPLVRKKLYERLSECGNDFKKAFSNLDENPIYLKNPIPKDQWKNKDIPSHAEKGISIKRVTLYGVNNVEPLNVKRNQFGEVILNEHGKPIDNAFVSTSNNHHVAIYKDASGKLNEKVVSFYEAVSRAKSGLPIVDKTFNDHLGWEFQFTLKQNEYFIFPSEDFNPKEIDIFDTQLYPSISKNLYRVQKISTKNYVFNHHLETQAVNGDTLKNKTLADVSYRFIWNLERLIDVVKVRINHLGKIIEIVKE